MCHRDVGIQELYVTIQRIVNLNSVKLSANFGLTLTRTLSKRLIFTKVSVSIMCSRDSCFSPLSLLCLPSFSQRYENSCPYPLPLLHHLPFPLCSIAFLHPFPLLLLEWQVTSILSTSVHTFQFLPFWTFQQHRIQTLNFFLKIILLMPAPLTTSSLVTTPQIFYVLAIRTCSLAPGTSCIYGFSHSVLSTRCAFLLLWNYHLSDLIFPNALRSTSNASSALKVLPMALTFSINQEVSIPSFTPPMNMFPWI